MQTSLGTILAAAAQGITAAVLSSATGTKTGQTTASGTVTTDTGSGTLYWVATTSATPPTSTQVKAGQTNTGSAAPASGSQAVSATGSQGISVTGLTPNTTYYLYYAQDNGVDSNVAASSSFTTDALTKWTSPTASIKFGKRNRVGTGNALCGYLGASGGTVTITGTGSSDWQWVATETAGTVGRTSKARGLCPKNGAGAYNSAWVASPSNSYTLTLTDDGTGEVCIVTVDLNWSKTFEGVTYTAANAIIAAADYDWGANNGGTGLRTYLDRTPTDGGCIMVRNGYNPFYTYTSSTASMASGFKSGADSGYVAPSWSDKLVYDPTFLHGDGISALRVEGETGGNKTLIIPESDYGATIRTLRPAAGCKVARFLIEKGSSANAIYQAADDITVCYCRITSASGSGQLIFPSGTIWRGHFYNNVLHDAGDAIVAGFRNNYIAGNWFYRLSSDGAKISTDFTTNTPTSIDGCYSQNIATQFPVELIGGAHPDVLQYYFQGTYSGTLPGTYRVRQNLSTNWYAQFLFGGGGSSSTTKADVTVELNCHFGTAANGIGTPTTTDDQIVRNNSLLRDLQNAYGSATSPILNVGGAGAFATTVEDNITAVLTVTTPSAAGSAGYLANNRNIDLANNQAEYEAMFYAPPGAGSGGVRELDLAWGSYEEAALEIWKLAAPKKGVAVASGGAMNTDGTYRGALFPYDAAYPVQFNVVGGIYATTYTLGSSASSISEDGSVTITVTLKDGSGNNAVRGWDTVFVLTEGGTAGNTGTYNVTVLAGESTGTVVATEAGTTTGTWTFTPTSTSDLTDPSALSVTVGAGVPPSLNALTPTTINTAENTAIGTDVATISGNSVGSTITLTGAASAYIEAYSPSTDVWKIRTKAALDYEYAGGNSFAWDFTETLAGAVGSPKVTSGVFNITNVNEGPIWNSTVSVSTTAGDTDPIALSGYCFDPEGTSLTFTAQTSLPTGWSIVSNQLVPAANAQGGSFTCRASDGSLTADKTVTLTVTAATGRTNPGLGLERLRLGL